MIFEDWTLEALKAERVKLEKELLARAHGRSISSIPDATFRIEGSGSEMSPTTLLAQVNNAIARREGTRPRGPIYPVFPAR